MTVAEPRLNNEDPASVASFAAKRLLALISSGALAAEVAAGERSAYLFRDLTRERFITQLRARFETSLAAGEALPEMFASQIEALLITAEDGAKQQAIRDTAVAAAVLLISVARARLCDPAPCARTLGAARRLLALLHSPNAHSRCWSECGIEVSVQMSQDSQSREKALEWLLRHPGDVESLSYHYFETTSLSELYLLRVQRLRDQLTEDELSQINSFEGLAPLLQGGPAPGGASESVLLVGDFAVAVAEDQRDASAGTLDMEAWTERVARTQRILQWEFFATAGADRPFLGLSTTKKIRTLPSVNFIDRLTDAWWKYVCYYEPLPLGPAMQRAPRQTAEIEAAKGMATRNAAASLAAFDLVLQRIDSLARGDVHQRVARRITDQMIANRGAGGAGTLFVHDGELTFDALKWLVAGSGGTWRKPTLEDNGFIWQETGFADFIAFCGIGIDDGETVILTPRWRSFVRWLRAGGQGAEVAEHLERLGLNRVPRAAFKIAVGKLHSDFAWPATEEASAAAVSDCRAPFLPTEVFLRAYRPWPSHLIVTMVHATREGEGIRPLSFGFATVVGDLPNSTERQWRAFEGKGLTDGATSEDSRSTDAARGRRFFLGWLNTHCSLLAGIGMSLGVSAEMAGAVTTQEERWRLRIWPPFTGRWFENDDSAPIHNWLPNNEMWAQSLEQVEHRLHKVTGLKKEFWGVGRSEANWEEWKSLFGWFSPFGDPDPSADDKDLSDRRLRLGGLWVLILAYLHERAVTPSQIEAIIGNRCPLGDPLSGTLLWSDATRSQNRAAAMHLGPKLLGGLLFNDKDSGKLVLRKLVLEPDCLWLELDIHLYRPSRGHQRSLWDALLGRGGKTTAALKEYRGFARDNCPSGVPPDVVVMPSGSPAGKVTRVGFTSWQPS